MYTREDAKASVGAGWHGLIDRLYDSKPNDVIVTQVKEKFGGLRFYVSSAPEEYHNIIDQAEFDSHYICEVCGRLGGPQPGAWIKTLCDEHAKDRE